MKTQGGKKQTILFLSGEAGRPGPNLAAVRDRMKERGMEQSYRIEEYGYNVQKESRGSGSEKALVKKLAEANIIVIDDHVPILDRLHLDPDQKLIQLWHAGVGFKATGYSRWGHKGAVSPFSSHRQITYATVSSVKIRSIFSELWGISDAKVLPCGIPRMDAMLDPDKQEKAKRELLSRFPVCEGKQVVLFAPTYRGRGKADADYPLEKIDFDGLYNIAKEQDLVVLFKMHPWITRRGFVPEGCRDRLIEVPATEPINALFLISDLLITDYSSNLFEYAALQKPMLFFAFDEAEYAKDRGFHRPYRENAPGKVVSSFSDLLEAVRTKDYEEEKVAAYVSSHFDRIDASSCDRVIDWLIEEKIPQPYKDELEKQKALRKKLPELHFG